MSVLYVNCKTVQPGCVLIQAGLGGDRDLLDHFDNDDWQVDGIEDMVPVPAREVPKAAEVRAALREAGAELATPIPDCRQASPVGDKP